MVRCCKLYGSPHTGGGGVTSALHFPGLCPRGGLHPRRPCPQVGLHRPQVGGGVVSGHMTPTRARGSAMYAAYLWFHTACMKKMGDGANPLCEGCLRAAKEAVAEPRAKRGRQM